MKKGKGRNNGLLPNSLRIISSCLKTVSSNASNVASSVRTAGASVAASISASSEDPKEQVTWAGFDKLELGPFLSRRVLLLGYQNGFQVLDVEDASNFNELVSKRDGPVTFLQMQPLPAESNGPQGFRASHPMLLVVSRERSDNLNLAHNHGNTVGLSREWSAESEASHSSPTTVQFFSVRSHGYVHVLRFRFAVCMVRCSPRIVAIGLAAQIYCFDAVTLENKFIVLTYPVPQLVGQGPIGVNFGYGPMAVGPRWLAYASNNPLSSNANRLSPQSLTPSPGISPSTSPSNGNLVARYAMESSKHLAAGIINLGDLGYKTLSKYCQELIPDGSNSPVSSSSGWKVGRLSGTESENAGMVVVKDFVSRAVISQFKAHTSPISALCFDPSGSLLVTASVYGNTINVFRIMPCSTHSGSETHQYRSSSHVHLYRLHRGMTSAIIQDICFSQYSQWVGIVSSKGTCHVFVLSPFGGDPGFQGNSSKGEEVSLSPSPTSTRFVTSSFLDGAVKLPKQLFAESGVAPYEVSRTAKGVRELLRLFRELKQSVISDWGGYRHPIVEEDKDFLERKEKLHELEQKLSSTSQQAESLVKAQQDMGETFGDLGLAFIKLTKFETEEAVFNTQRARADNMKTFATAAVKASRLYRELNLHTIKHLDTLHEYLGLLLAVHAAFSDRSNALLTVQSLVTESSALHSRSEEMEVGSSKVFGGDKSRIRKIDELKEIIRLTEDSKNAAVREYEYIKENNRTELERTDHERHVDFLNMLKGFIVNQVGYAEKIAYVWGKVAEETSEYVKRG